ncbi:hypothetical protein F4775DRAFT_135989 [Biscogniauxia sp. FL1348]|nr:hypothetical protein F4775DRAFT_135989 [Biscogniauxia sp. FL1348]
MKVRSTMGIPHNLGETRQYPPTTTSNALRGGRAWRSSPFSHCRRLDWQLCLGGAGVARVFDPTIGVPTRDRHGPLFFSLPSDQHQDHPSNGDKQASSHRRGLSTPRLLMPNSSLRVFAEPWSSSSSPFETKYRLFATPIANRKSNSDSIVFLLTVVAVDTITVVGGGCLRYNRRPRRQKKKKKGKGAVIIRFENPTIISECRMWKVVVGLDLKRMQQCLVFPSPARNACISPPLLPLSSVYMRAVFVSSTYLGTTFSLLQGKTMRDEAMPPTKYLPTYLPIYI